VRRAASRHPQRVRVAQQLVVGTLQKRFQPRPSGHQWQSAQIPTVDLQQIEAHRYAAVALSTD